MPRICDTLATLDRSGKLTTAQLERILGYADRSCYPYLSHRVLDAQQLYALFHATKPDVQLAFLNFLSDGTGWTHEFIEASADIDGDGDVDVTDLMRGSVDACDLNAKTIKTALKAIDRGMSKLSPDLTQSLNNTLDQTIQSLIAVRRAVRRLSPKPA
jgi:hypothetical protein